MTPAPAWCVQCESWRGSQFAYGEKLSGADKLSGLQQSLEYRERISERSCCLLRKVCKVHRSEPHSHTMVGQQIPEGTPVDLISGSRVRASYVA